MQRRLLPFVFVLMLVWFVAPSAALAEFSCWCRTGANVCNHYRLPDPAAGSTRDSACQTRCGSDTRIAVEDYAGAGHNDRAADICHNRGGAYPTGAAAPCAADQGSCTARETVGATDFRYSCTCQMARFLITGGANPNSCTYTAAERARLETEGSARITNDTPTPDYVVATDDAQAATRCQARCRTFADELNTASASEGVRCVNTTVTRLSGGASVTTPPAINTNSTFGTSDPGAAAGRAGRTATLSDPLGGVSVPQLLGRIINAFLGVTGSLGLAVFVYGGFEWLTSAGNPEKIKKGRDAIVWATLGLALVFGAYAIVNFVLRAILSAAG